MGPLSLLLCSVPAENSVVSPAVFVLFTLLSRFAEHDKPASMKQLAAGSHPELGTRYRRSRPPAAAARRSGSERACVPHARPADHESTIPTALMLKPPYVA